MNKCHLFIHLISSYLIPPPLISSLSSSKPVGSSRTSTRRFGVGGGEPPLDETSIPRELQEAIDLAMDSEESKALLQDLAAAEERVLRARAELEEVARQERKLQELRAELELESKADAGLEKAEEEVRIEVA